MSCKLEVRTDSIQGKMLNFLIEKGTPNLAKVFGEGSITLSNKKNLKNGVKLFSMLKNVAESFQKNGMFKHKGDKVIQFLNSRFF